MTGLRRRTEQGCGLGVIAFDAETEAFIGDDEANRFLMREYRKPWSLEG